MDSTSTDSQYSYINILKTHNTSIVIILDQTYLRMQQSHYVKPDTYID